MKINEHEKILSEKIILVPYETTHVLKYHQWMEDEEIRRLTGSERLTLEEEYEMQRSWRNDEDKLTFIILSKICFEKTEDETESMIGDVNLFINSEEKSAEVEIMIAEKSARGKGIAHEAVSLIISYAIQKLGIRKYFVKITDDNAASLHLNSL
ncbi:unnamed protein product [Caenorhabditis bovis]|uniref:N-acetyltransferase domain-containing protein n=1 Tax=Caenorhabditis bovis TaxID=2654633 RepID=A0A8S1EKV3_9PELO|nr:unnamed protein product [Caenorhabditis bovis]